eukprot:3401053-Rhodomonas_salina.1
MLMHKEGGLTFKEAMLTCKEAMLTYKEGALTHTGHWQRRRGHVTWGCSGCKRTCTRRWTTRPLGSKTSASPSRTTKLFGPSPRTSRGA